MAVTRKNSKQTKRERNETFYRLHLLPNSRGGAATIVSRHGRKRRLSERILGGRDNKKKLGEREEEEEAFVM